ncbi:MAG: hypothetical protein KA371_14290 [Acidobacteria bacterium]|nr:hypothetical protein [Acidobacteriota bacterium]
MAKKRVFISFDYDHDEALRTLLVGQARHDDSPFSLADWSIRERIDENWRAKARTRIRCVDTVCVICGEHTESAAGVSAELRIAQDEEVPYFLLAGYSDKTCTKPCVAKSGDKLYRWTWDNLKTLVGGGR